MPPNQLKSWVNKTTKEAFDIIAELAEESRRFNQRSTPRSTKSANAVEVNNSLNTEVKELKDLMKQMLLSNGAHHVKACGICAETNHPTDACPILQEPAAKVNVVGGFGQQRPRFDPYSNTYNPGWGAHPNFRWNQQQQYNQQGG